jgi:hypothetical protein
MISPHPRHRGPRSSACVAWEEFVVAILGGRAFILLVSAGLVGCGVALAGSLVGHGMVDFRGAARSVTVKGVAEQDATADLATLTLAATVADADVTEGERRLAAQIGEVVTFLKDAGFVNDEIALGALSVHDALADTYRAEKLDPAARFVLRRAVSLRSTRPDAVRRVGGRTGELVGRGIVLSDTGGPRYAVTVAQLNRIKPDLIRRATRAARAAAAEFAESSGAAVGGIRSANQGVIKILARDDATAEHASLEKRVRAVTTVQYTLTR